VINWPLFNFESSMASRALIMKFRQFNTHVSLTKQIKVIGLATMGALNTYAIHHFFLKNGNKKPSP